MTIDINQFWNLLSESNLVDVRDAQNYFTEFSNDDSVSQTPDSLSQWLVQRKAITKYQAEILQAGFAGPFQYGRYTAIGQVEDGLNNEYFDAVHTRTQFPVTLQFISGSNSAHLEKWNGIEEECAKLEDSRCPYLIPIFESVVTPKHRFLVYPRFSNRLSDKLPRKARLNWQQACTIAACAAEGLESLHKADIVHNAISPRAIFLSKTGAILRFDPLRDRRFSVLDSDDEGAESLHDFLAPEHYQADATTNPASDIYSLGCTLVRIFTGRPLFKAATIKKKIRMHQQDSLPDFTKFKIPPQLNDLLQRMLAKNPDSRPQSVGEIKNILALLSGKAEEVLGKTLAVSPLERKYRTSIRQSLPIGVKSVEAAPELAVESEVSRMPAEERAAKIAAAKSGIASRKNAKFKNMVAVAAGVILTAGLLGYFAWSASQKKVTQFVATPASDSSSTESGENSVAEPKLSPYETVAQLPLDQRPRIFQELIDDDRQSLWESPTAGPPAAFTSLPVAPKILMTFRPSELVNSAEGSLFLRSLGSQVSTEIDSLESSTGLTMDEIELIIVSFHSDGALRNYVPYFSVTPKATMTLDALLARWQNPVSRQLENGEVIFEAADSPQAFYISESDFASTDESDSKDSSELPKRKRSVKRFGLSSIELIEDVALSAGANILSGALKDLADQSDRQRHLNFLFMRQGLFNDEGQNFMGETLATLNRELDLMIPDNIRGGLVSVHLDQGTYAELIFDRNIDLKAVDLQEQMTEQFRSQRDRITEFVAQIPANPYWDRVRVKYDNMINDLYRNIRWDVEQGELVANVWLAPMAAHNLVAASELALSFASGSSPSILPARKVPQSLEELLASKRDLNIANPPDLNVLLADLQTEVSDDFGKLPFPFNIRLLGSDLEKDGITKNQRPSELVLNQKSLSEILTSIMTKANPDKNITGPEDPNCKLIWVIADDPEQPGQKAILVTTRAAAAEKSYPIPAPFRSQ